MSLSGLDNLKPEFDQYKLVAQKLQEWEWFNRFIKMNPDIKLRWEQHKTYEILKDEQLK